MDWFLFILAFLVVAAIVVVILIGTDVIVLPEENTAEKKEGTTTDNGGGTTTDNGGGTTTDNGGGTTADPPVADPPAADIPAQEQDTALEQETPPVSAPPTTPAADDPPAAPTTPAVDDALIDGHDHYFDDMGDQLIVFEDFNFTGYAKRFKASAATFDLSGFSRVGSIKVSDSAKVSFSKNGSVTNVLAPGTRLNYISAIDYRTYDAMTITRDVLPSTPHIYTQQKRFSTSGTEILSKKIFDTPLTIKSYYVPNGYKLTLNETINIRGPITVEVANMTGITTAEAKVVKKLSTSKVHFFSDKGLIGTETAFSKGSFSTELTFKSVMIPNALALKMVHMNGRGILLNGGNTYIYGDGFQIKRFEVMSASNPIIEKVSPYISTLYDSTKPYIYSHPLLTGERYDLQELADLTDAYITFGSVIVPEGYKVQFFSEKDFAGGRFTIAHGCQVHQKVVTELGFVPKSIKVIKEDAPEYCLLFSEPYLRGRKIEVKDKADFAHSHMRVKSVYIPQQKYDLQLYKSNGGSNKIKTFTTGKIPPSFQGLYKGAVAHRVSFTPGSAPEVFKDVGFQKDGRRVTSEFTTEKGEYSSVACAGSKGVIMYDGSKKTQSLRLGRDCKVAFLTQFDSVNGNWNDLATRFEPYDA